ncbi:MAG TPA: hypothetical protein VER33_19595, partial [Polyangiaceae bacterium]|nr:hypothetical protein [Polyangiaceae bacterium]
MKQLLTAIVRYVAALTLTWAAFAGCSSDLPTDINGLPCDEQGRCVTGYKCHPLTLRCVRPDQLPGPAAGSGGGGGAIGGAIGGAGGLPSNGGSVDPGEGPTGPEDCLPGETLCGNECVTLSEDPDHCGGCNATCTAPEAGVAV